MSGGIYVFEGEHDGEQLLPLTQPPKELIQRPYPTEDRLQSFLESHPALLGGEQINATSPRRWLLVSREMGVPGEESGAARWSVDHLFVDQDAIPTLVEVKRSTDTRIRREVVGQMLDYAANGVAYWPPGTLQASFVATCERRKLVAEEEFLRLQTQFDQSQFWQLADRNLAEGKLRLLFVADRIPVELRRIVEFLNGQMNRTEVLAVEIVQYVGGGLSALVPRVIGQVGSTNKNPASKPSRTWDLPTLLEELTSKVGPEAAESARRIYEGALERRPQIQVRWGRGATVGNFSLTYAVDGASRTLAYIETNGRLTGFDADWLLSHPSLALEPARTELTRRLERMPGVMQQVEAGKWPSIPLTELNSDAAMSVFWFAVDWALGQIAAGATRTDIPSGPDEGSQ